MLLNISANTIIKLKSPTGNPSVSSFGELKDYKNNKFYITSEAYTGTVAITKLDNTNKIISGTFEFKATGNSDPSDIINVTDGWFDITYK